MVVTLAETTNLYPVHKLKLSVSFCSSFVSFHDTHIRLQKQSKFENFTLFLTSIFHGGVSDMFGG